MTSHLRELEFTKGHGTGNDFVIIADLAGALDLDPRLVRALCDRRRGIGADGVLRVLPAGQVAGVEGLTDSAAYFMDYRNADGSNAQMCGNGARVFARYLVATGLQQPGQFQIVTRGGVRGVHVTEEGDVSVNMGQARIMEDTPLSVSIGRGSPRPAVGVHMPNPHAVTFVADLGDVGALGAPPEVSPAGVFPDGVNCEFVVDLGRRHIGMRVHERGVGETLSCGTGACAAAVVVASRDGAVRSGAAYRVDVPGGRLEVTWHQDGEVELSGPAVLVARGSLEPGWAADLGVDGD